MMTTRKPNKKRRLFIVGIILGVISLIVFVILSNLVKAKTGDARPPCTQNLRQIAAAKDQWAFENKMTNGAIPDTNAVLQYIKGAQMPICPEGGTYSLNPVGTNPTCSIGGQRHSLPVP